jgi:nucleosome-remodeling factor subunit BPTF
MWALGGPTALAKTNRNGKHSSNTGYSDDEDDDDIPAEEETEKSNDDTDQMHRRLWCICKKPWDHSRLMLRCDSCANWYHGDW